MRMGVKEAAQLMQASEHFIRLGLRAGVFPWGYAVKTSSRWTYYIFQEKFEEDLRIRNEKN